MTFNQHDHLHLGYPRPTAYEVEGNFKASAEGQLRLRTCPPSQASSQPRESNTPFSPGSTPLDERSFLALQPRLPGRT